MPAIVELWGYDVQNSSFSSSSSSSSFDRSTPITQKQSNIKTRNFKGVLVSVTTRDWS